MNDMRRVVAAKLGLLCLCCCPAQAQVVLRHKVDEGVKYTYEVSQFASQVKTSPGEKVYKEEIDTSVVFSVEGGRRDDSIRQIVKFESLRNNYTQTSPNGSQTLAFDSTTNVAKVEPPGDEFRGMGFFLDVFKALLGASYTVVVDKENELSIEGAAEIVNNASPRAAKWLGGPAGHGYVDRLKAVHEQVLKRFPDKSLNLGDTWERTGNVEVYLVGGLIQVERQYECLGTEERDGRTLDKIGWTDKKVVERPRPKLPERNLPANRPFQRSLGRTEQVVESKGTLYFDRQLGVEVESVHHFHYRYRLPAEKLFPEQDVSMKIQTSQRLKE
jgi:hypothetical protein